MAQNKLSLLPATIALTLLTLAFFWKILLTNLILSGVDVFLYFYPYKAYAAEALRQGRLPLWNPHLFMGAPLLANSQVGLFYPLNWPFIWLDAPRQVSWSIGLHIALAGVLMFLFVRRSLALGRPGAMVAAILFAFGGYLGAQVEHINQLQAAAWLPLLFLLYDLGLPHKKASTQPAHCRWVWFLPMALLVAIILFAGHAQTVFISLFGLGLYGLWRAVVSSQKSVVRNQSGYWHLATGIPLLKSVFRHLFPLLIVSVLAVALAAVQLLPTAELSSLSIRSQGLTYQEVVSFSLRPTNLHYSLLPPLNLDLTQILGQAFSEWVAYLGVSGLLLALLGTVLSLWQAKSRPFLLLCAAGLVLSLGVFTGPLYLALYYLVPGFGLFRVPARWLLLYAFGAAVLAGYGFDALRRPKVTVPQLQTVWRRLNIRRRHWLLPALPILGLLALLAWKTPPFTTISAWILLAAVTIGLLALALRPARRAKWATPLLATMLVAELFWAAQSLNYNEPTAPQAFRSLRNSIAFLKAADSTEPPGRFLSLSGITYDPGDLSQLQQIFGDHLSEPALYNLIVATKQKEVLFFNLPMLYGLHSVDGYDGGILPLTRFLTFQKLFLPADNLSTDGRLREKLKFVPDNWLLSLTNTRWIITDKQFDAWIDGIFYDLQFPAQLASGQQIGTTNIPDFTATAIGLVSHLEGGAGLPADSPVAEVSLTYADGQVETFELLAGRDTAEGNYNSTVAHPQANVGVEWPYEQGGVDYIAVKPLKSIAPIAELSVQSMLADGLFVLRGVSLINQPTTTSRSIVLSTSGRLPTGS